MNECLKCLQSPGLLTKSLHILRSNTSHTHSYERCVTMMEKKNSAHAVVQMFTHIYVLQCFVHSRHFGE